jgi:hypothetical protein
MIVHNGLRIILLTGLLNGMFACGNVSTEQITINNTMEAGEGVVAFELGKVETLDESIELPSRAFYLLADGKKWEIGRLEGSAELVPNELWVENGIPANALAVVHNYHAADFYYYAIRQEGRVMVYEGGPYIDESTNELKFIYENRIDPLLIGRWEEKESPEMWTFYNGQYYFGDGYEDGISYRLKDDTLFTGIGDTQVIEKLTENEFIVRDAAGTYKHHWIKADFD